MSSVFVGNGINLAEKISMSWDRLLAEIYEPDTAYISNTFGMTLRYEYIDSRSDLSGYQLKKRIARQIDRNAKEILKRKHSVHKKIVQLPVDSILTTNYDYSMEYAVEPQFKCAKNTTERDYSFRRYQMAAEKQIYHIHGECGYPSSICLGFEHYAGMTEKMRSSLVKSTEKALGGGHKFALYDVLAKVEETAAQPTEWYYKLFQEDIYFLGFSMDSSENDIWWLLTYRNRLIKEYPDLIKNKLYYMEIDPKEGIDKSVQQKALAKRELLTALNVYVVDCAVAAPEYGYEKAIRWIGENLSAGKSAEAVRES